MQALIAFTATLILCSTALPANGEGIVHAHNYGKLVAVVVAVCLPRLTQTTIVRATT